MSTNYYLTRRPRFEELMLSYEDDGDESPLDPEDVGIHLGMNSGGHAFLFHYIRQFGVCSYPLLVKLLEEKLKQGWVLYSEYPREVSLEQFKEVVEASKGLPLANPQASSAPALTGPEGFVFWDANFG